MTHDVWLTKIFNTYLAGVGNALLALFKRTAENPRQPWADHVVMEIVTAVLLMALLLILRFGLSVEKPGITQHIFEVIHKFVVGEAEDQAGHEAHHHITIFMTLFLFILLGNLVGLIPGFISPTQSIYVTVGCALVAFAYYNIVGLKKNGLWRYTKHFFGPIPLMAPLMLPIEIVSHLARPLSLSIRLFANMYAGEKVTMTFLGLTYLIVPTIFMGLHVFVALLQAYIFMLMTIIYVAGAVAEDH